MSATGHLCLDPFWCESDPVLLPPKLSRELALKLDDDDDDNFRFHQSIKSNCSSTCHSDDSGIEPTLALTPTSPLPGDSDSEDIHSLDGFPNICFSDNSYTDQCDLLNGANLPPNDLPSIHHTSRGALHSATARRCKVSAGVGVPSTSPFWSKSKLGRDKVDDNRFHLLSYEQIVRLNSILSDQIKIHSRHKRFPCVELQLSQLFHAVQHKLRQLKIPVKDMRLNGGVASYIIGMESTPKYNDVDILISVDLSSNPLTIQKVKSAVLAALMQFFPKDSGLTSPNVNTCTPNCDYYPMQYSFDKTLLPENTSCQPHDKEIQSCHSDVLMVDPAPQLASRWGSEMLNAPQFELFNEPNSLLNDSMTSSLALDEEECNVSAFNLKNTDVGHDLTLLPQKNSTINRSPADMNSLHCSSVAESYVYKQFRKFSPQETDCWSLLSLGMPETDSKVIEFKFVDRMRRQFEFTVDSFQLHLDSMLSFIEHHPPNALDINFYPTVVAESVAGSFNEALYHLKNKLIITSEPEMIRGGGLLKYCRLISINYHAPDGIDTCSLERYMSSRFFIDFQDLDSQRSKLESFLHNHFAQHAHSEKIDFLKTFYRVVNGSAVCLMSHERYQTLALTSSLLEQLNQQTNSETSLFCLTGFVERHNLTLDKIYVGKHLFPKITTSPDCGWSCQHGQGHLIMVANGSTGHSEGKCPLYYKTPISPMPVYDVASDTLSVSAEFEILQHPIEDMCQNVNSDLVGCTSVE